MSDKETSKDKELVIDSDGVCDALQVGERILIEDGLLEVLVTEKDGEMVKAEVINGGEIKPRKGINMPDTILRFGAVTKKDLSDLEFALEEEVDFVGLSFVSNAQEILETRERIKQILGREKDLPQIVAKIERKEAIKNLDEIIQATDVVMVARGDLGIELDETRVVIYQKEIIAKCLQMVRPVIVATQMLDSMINNPIPTRAEVSDVSNAVIDHTDAVMLSGESANGKYPIKAVSVMKDIILNTEDSPFDSINSGYLDKAAFSDYSLVINSAHELEKNSGAKAIVMYTNSGFTTRMMSHHRPKTPIFVATNNPKTYQQLAIVWGIRAYLFNNGEERENFIELIVEKAKSDGKLSSGDKVVVVLGCSPESKDCAMVGLREVN